MATTPAHAGSFFACLTHDIIEANKNGNHLFHLVNHSIVCDDCKKDGIDECCHVLGNVPTWKAVVGFNKINELIPNKRQGDFRKELLGIIKEDGGR
jgi:hypothetical protein